MLGGEYNSKVAFADKRLIERTAEEIVAYLQKRLNRYKQKYAIYHERALTEFKDESKRLHYQRLAERYRLKIIAFERYLEYDYFSIIKDYLLNGQRAIKNFPFELRQIIEKYIKRNIKFRRSKVIVEGESISINYQNSSIVLVPSGIKSIAIHRYFKYQDYSTPLTIIFISILFGLYNIYLLVSSAEPATGPSQISLVEFIMSLALFIYAVLVLIILPISVGLVIFWLYFIKYRIITIETQDEAIIIIRSWYRELMENIYSRLEKSMEEILE